MEQKINPKQRILFLITQSEWGGAQQFLYQLIHSLDKARFEVTLATGSDGGGELADKLGKDVHTIRLNSLKRTPSLLSDIRSLFEIRDTLNAIRPDIFFLNSSKAGFNGSLAARFLKLTFPKPRVIYRIGGWTFNDPWPIYKKVFYFVLEWLSAHWKDTIIVNSDHDLAQVDRYAVFQGKIQRIYNGLDLASTHFLPRSTARTELSQLSRPLDDTRITLGTIANFYPTKGLTHLIEAMSLLQDPAKYQLIIVGDGQQRVALASLIKEKQLTNVILTGRLDHASRYLKAFDIFVLPSVKEGFPWAILEAMLSRIPIIATRVGALSEIIDHQRSGLLVQGGDALALATAIDALSDSSKRQELATQALVKVQRDFTLREMIDSYTRLFLEN